jgi:threonine synthase
VRYVSTRGFGTENPLPFGEILLEGLAPDGGLFVPQSYPQVSEAQLEQWRTLLTEQGYAALAAQIVALFVDDIPLADLKALCAAAYGTGHDGKPLFSNPDIVPVRRLSESEIWLAGLSFGPTAAFKDLAMQLLGQLFDYQLRRIDSWLTVLGATSGDTGSAAEYAMLGRERVRVAMLTPAGRMTPFQRAQMYTIADPRIANVAVDGVFDDCQDLVKAVNTDGAFKQRWHIGAVNSMNWGRLVGQVVYYFAAYLRTVSKIGQPVSFAVPTGNFGNILAGHIARSMGLPIRDLVLATNENNVLVEFFETGVYRPRGSAETYATSSPSMDISKASNFERFIFDLFGRDAQRTADLFGRQLSENGQFDLSGTPEFAAIRDRYGFVAGSSTHQDRVATIHDLWERDGVLIDPHTADGVHVAQVYLDRVTTPLIAFEVALPVKFADTIHQAIGTEPPLPQRFEGIMQREQHVIPMPNDVDALKAWLSGWLSR